MYYIAIDKLDNTVFQYGENYIFTKEDLIEMARKGKLIVENYIIYEIANTQKLQFSVGFEVV